MIMKLSSFRIRFLTVLFLLMISMATVHSQEKYERRITRYQNLWQSLIPSYTKIQYAGSMGLISIGTGWDYGKNNQWETDIFVGFVPKYSTESVKFTLTLKQNFIPWNLRLNDHFRLDPLTCGVYFNTVFGEEFWVSEPDKYPSGYYPFSTKLRLNIFVGQRITFQIPQERLQFAKSVTFFYEISTNELYLISAIQNSYLKPKDYLGLSLGLKFQLF